MNRSLKGVSLTIISVTLFALSVAIAHPATADESGGRIDSDRIDFVAVKRVGATLPGGPNGSDSGLPDKEFRLVPSCFGTNVPGRAMDSPFGKLCDETRLGACKERPGGLAMQPQSTARGLGAWRDDGVVTCVYGDQAVDVAGEIAARMESEFQRLPIAAGKFGSQPGPATLLNRETNFWVRSIEQVFDIELLGQRVHVRAIPTGYTYRYGDGAAKGPTQYFGPLLGEDQQFAPTVTSHRYSKTGDFQASVVTHFRGVYSVNGGPELPITGQGNVASPGVLVRVFAVEVRNVSGDCASNPGTWGCTNT